MAKAGRTTVYNDITSAEKLKQVNPENIQLENDYLEYLSSTDKASGTIKQYRANLHVLWCWALDNNKNKFFVDFTKREAIKFQNHANSVWNWSSKRIRTVKATFRSLENYITDILDDEFPNYKPIWSKIESPADTAVRVKTVFQEDDLKPLLDSLVGKEEYMKACMLALAINCGKRKSELLRFKASYFGDENLICNGALYKTPEKVVTKGRGRRGKLLDVYILAKPFKPYLDLWMNKRQELGITSDWLFPKYEDGKWLDEQMPTSTLDSWARTFSDMLGKPFYWHSIRHYNTTYLSENGVPEGVIQDFQGWSSSDMLRIYIDSSSEKQFEKYFGVDGIKKVEKKSLDEL